MSTGAARGAGGPVELADRAPAPDLARGAMLLLIALAHAPAYLFGQTMGRGGYPADGTALDRGVVFAEVTFVVGRAYPMFALLMGYGLAQLWARQVGAGREPSAVQRLVRRRGRWLVAFGLVHAGLLWAGDILGAYGVIAILLGAGLLRASDRLIAALVGLSVAVVAAGGVVIGLTDVGGGTSVLASTGETNGWMAAGLRLAEWAPSLLLQPLGMLGAVLAGVWAARRAMLDHTERHVRTLRWMAVIGLTVAFCGGLPWAAIVAGWWPDPSPAAAAIAAGLHAASGYAGAAYAAAIALVARGRRPHPGIVRRALIACGRRSLTCYLLQSVVLVALMACYGGGLGNRMGAAAAAGAAVGTWLLTIALAVAMERMGARGPAEAALRKLTYREH